jgi:hypothetical protein
MLWATKNDFYLTTTLDGSVTFPFVIPSVVDGPTVVRCPTKHSKGLITLVIRPFNPAIRLAVHHVPNACVVTALKAHAVIVALITLHIRMAKFVTVVYVWLTMVLIVLASALHAVVETTTRSVAEFRRRGIPSAGRVCLRRRTLRLSILSPDCPGGTQ